VACIPILDALSYANLHLKTVSSMGSFLEVEDPNFTEYSEKTWRAQIPLFIILLYNMQTQ